HQPARPHRSPSLLLKIGRSAPVAPAPSALLARRNPAPYSRRMQSPWRGRQARSLAGLARAIQFLPPRELLLPAPTRWRCAAEEFSAHRANGRIGDGLRLNRWIPALSRQLELRRVLMRERGSTGVGDRSER